MGETEELGGRQCSTAGELSGSGGCEGMAEARCLCSNRSDTIEDNS